MPVHARSFQKNAALIALPTEITTALNIQAGIALAAGAPRQPPIVAAERVPARLFDGYGEFMAGLTRTSSTSVSGPDPLAMKRGLGACLPDRATRPPRQASGENQVRGKQAGYIGHMAH